MLYLIYLFGWTFVVLLGGFGLGVTAIWLLGIACIVVREFARAAYKVVKEFLK